MQDKITIADAPDCLNTNDKAMWVLGYQASIEARSSCLFQIQEPVTKTEALAHYSQQAILAMDEAAPGIAIPAPQLQADARDAEQERWMEIGKAIERACIDQPDSTEIVISLERDAGTVTMFDPDGNEHDQFSHEDGFAGVVNAAIDAAIAAQAAAQGGE